MLSKTAYIQKLQFETVNLADLADDTYAKMLPAERMEVDLFCQKLHKRLKESSKANVKLGVDALRELALALFMIVEYQGNNMTACLNSGLQGKHR